MAADSDGNLSGVENLRENSSDSDAMTEDADSYDLSYVEVTPAGTYSISIPEGTRGRGSKSMGYSHFVVYTKSSLVEQTTPAFLTLEEAMRRGS